MLKFIHAADIHLDSPFLNLDRYEGAPVTTLRRATRRAFENLVNLAVNEGADFVLICGDLYDGQWKDYNTGLFFVSQVRILREAGIPLFLVTGNHDAGSIITRNLRLPENVHLFPVDSPGSFRLESLNVTLHGQGFATPAVKNDLAALYPDADPGTYNIGLLHTCATGREGHEPYAPCSLTTLTGKGYDYWALGHVHLHEVLSQDPWVVFPGNIQGRHIGETGEKGCIVVQVTKNGRTRIRFEALDVFRWHRMEISTIGDNDLHGTIDEILEALDAVRQDADGRPTAVRIQVQSTPELCCTFNADPEYWISQVRAGVINEFGDQIWVEKVVFPVRRDSETESEPHPKGPMGEVTAVIRDLAGDEADPDAIQTALKGLLNRLPRELRQGKAAPKPEDPLWRTQMLAQVQALLLDRLRAEDKTQ